MPAPCRGVVVPHAVEAALVRSCVLIRRATEPGTPAARERKLIGRAAHRLATDAALTRHASVKARLGAACAPALSALLVDASHRALVFRDIVP